MKEFGSFARFFLRRPLLFVYSSVLATLILFFYRYVSVMDYLTGMAKLAGGNPLDLVVSFPQLVLTPNIRVTAIAIAAAVCAGGSLIMSFLFCGALGSVARCAADCVGFPARLGMGFAGGYARRFAPLAAVFFFELLVLTALALIWLIASVPIAVVSKAAEMGAISGWVSTLLAAITLVVFYAGFTAWRSVSVSALAPLYCAGGFFRGRVWCFVGSSLFKTARRIIVSDVILAAFVAAYLIAGKRELVLLAVGICAGVSAAFLAYSVFREYAIFDKSASGSPSRVKPGDVSAEGGQPPRIVVGSVVFDDYDDSAFEDYEDWDDSNDSDGQNDMNTLNNTESQNGAEDLSDIYEALPDGFESVEQHRFESQAPSNRRTAQSRRRAAQNRRTDTGSNHHA